MYFWQMNKRRTYFAKVFGGRRLHAPGTAFRVPKWFDLGRLRKKRRPKTGGTKGEELRTSASYSKMVHTSCHFPKRVMYIENRNSASTLFLSPSTTIYIGTRLRRSLIVGRYPIIFENDENAFSWIVYGDNLVANEKRRGTNTYPFWINISSLVIQEWLSSSGNVEVLDRGSVVRVYYTPLQILISQQHIDA